MDRPEKLVFSDESDSSFAWGAPLIGLAILALGFGIGLMTTDVTLADMILPFAALGTFWFVWVGFYSFIFWVHRVSDKRAINRMFDGEIWERWQFRALAGCRREKIILQKCSTFICYWANNLSECVIFSKNALLGSVFDQN